MSSIRTKPRPSVLAVGLLIFAAAGLLAALAGSAADAQAQTGHTLTVDNLYWDGSGWKKFTGEGGKRLTEGNSTASANVGSVHVYLNPARDQPTSVLICFKDTSTARLRNSLRRNGHEAIARDFDLIALASAATTDPSAATQLQLDRNGCHAHVIPANAASAAVSILIYGDTIKEGDETVVTELRRSATTPDGVAISETAGSTTLTIADDDGGALPILNMFPPGAVTEGQDAAALVLSSSSLKSGEGRYFWVRVSEPADAGYDFVDEANEGTMRVRLAEGTNYHEVAVPTVDDAVDEPDGFVKFSLLRGDGYLVGNSGPDSFDAPVHDNDPDRIISLGDLPSEVMEGQSLAVEVILTRPAAAVLLGAITVDNTDGSAANADLGLEGTFFTFAPGERKSTVNIPVTADSISDHGETFRVNLHPPDTYRIGDRSEAEFTVVEPAEYNLEGESYRSIREGFIMSLTVTRRKGFSNPGITEVGVATTANTATHRAIIGEDFLASSTVRVAGEGDAGSGYLPLQAQEDRLVEGSELFAVKITDPPAGSVIGPNNTVTLQIMDVNLVPPDWALAPSGLSDRDRFRLIFASSGTTKATSASIGDYDAWLRNLAANGGHAQIRPYAKTFQVLGSTAAVDAHVHTGTSPGSDGQVSSISPWDTPIHWLNGEMVASGHADLWDGAWENVSQGDGDVKDESGDSAAHGDRHWTGSNSNGSASAKPLGHTGPKVTYGKWSGNPLKQGSGDKSKSHRLIGISSLFEILDSPFFSVEVAQKQITEGEDIEFTIRSDPAPDQDTDFFLQALQEGSSHLEDGYIGIRKLTMPAGASSHTFSLSTVQDDVDEPDGKVTITFISGPNYRIINGFTEVAVAVQDDDPTRVTLTLSRPWMNETGNDNAVDLTVALSRPVGPHELVALPLKVKASGAVVNTDYTVALKQGGDVNQGVRLLTSGGTTPTPRLPSSVPYSEQNPAVELSRGVRKGVVTFTAIDDNVKKSRELAFGFGVGVIDTQMFGLGGGGMYLDFSPSSVAFIDDENTDPVAVSFRIGNYQFSELGNATGGVKLDGLIALSRGVGQDVQVPVKVTGGTATLGVDFENKSQVTATIPAGLTTASTSSHYHIRGLDDDLREPNETFTLTLLDPDGAKSGFVLGQNTTMTVTIRDDESGLLP